MLAGEGDLELSAGMVHEVETEGDGGSSERVCESEGTDSDYQSEVDDFKRCPKEVGVDAAFEIFADSEGYRVCSWTALY